MATVRPFPEGPNSYNKAHWQDLTQQAILLGSTAKPGFEALSQLPCQAQRSSCSSSIKEQLALHPACLELLDCSRMVLRLAISYQSPDCFAGLDVRVPRYTCDRFPITSFQGLHPSKERLLGRYRSSETAISTMLKSLAHSSIASCRELGTDHTTLPVAHACR